MQHLNYHNQNSWDFVSGTQQSPIALSHSKAQLDPELPDLTLSYVPTLNYVRDTGASIEFGITGQAILNHRPFHARQAHLHTPSEHLIDGQHFAAELHLVHEAKDGQMAVVAIPVEINEANLLFETVLMHMPTKTSFDLPTGSLLPKQLTYLHYLGSLTTPPLTENVEWYVLDHTISMSQDQLDRFHTFYEGNNRHLQPDNNRPVEYHQ